jgi:hypothetical protein
MSRPLASVSIASKSVDKCIETPEENPEHPASGSHCPPGLHAWLIGAPLNAPPVGVSMVRPPLLAMERTAMDDEATEDPHCIVCGQPMGDDTNTHHGEPCHVCCCEGYGMPVRWQHYDY